MKAKLEFNRLIKLDTVANAFAFILEKNSNSGFSSFSSDSNKHEYCRVESIQNTSLSRFSTTFDSINNSNTSQKRSFSLVIFELDMVSKQARVRRVGSDLKSINVEPKLTNKNGFGSLLSGDSRLNDSLFSDPWSNWKSDDTYKNDMIKTEKIPFNVTNNSTLVFKFEINIETPSEEGLYILSLFNCFQPQSLNYKLSEADLN